MGKGQRQRREQAANATAQLLYTDKRAAPSFGQPIPTPSNTNRPIGSITKTGSRGDKPNGTDKPEDTIDFNAVKEFLSFNPENRVRCLEEYLRLPSSLSLESIQLSEKNESSDTCSVPIKFNALELANIVQQRGISTMEGSLIVTTVVACLNNSSSETGDSSGPMNTEFALRVLCSLQNSIGRVIEPATVDVLSSLLSLHSNKVARVRELAQRAVGWLSESLSAPLLHVIFPTLMSFLELTVDWRSKVGALDLLHSIAQKPHAQSHISPVLPVFIPEVSECMKDSKKQVQSSATNAMSAACAHIINDDISHLVPQLVSVINHPEQSAATLDKLMETTFVATVDAPTLSLITPVLGKALRDRSSGMKRKAAKVIENMCKLVQNPYDVQPFEPLLLPALDKVIDEVADPEVREVSTAARGVLVKAMGKGEQAPPPDIAAFASRLTESIQTLLVNQLSCAGNLSTTNLTCRHIAGLLSGVILYGSTGYTATQIAAEGESSDAWRQAVGCTSREVWHDCVIPFAGPLVSSEESDISTHDMSAALRLSALNGYPDAQNDAGSDDAHNLCNIEFSLAFGGKILLHNARLSLGRGHRYGIMGKNGVGKTTLMTNIGSGNIEGLPEDLRTVYVQHDDPQANSTEVPVLEEVMATPSIVEVGVTEQEARDALMAIGFTEAMLQTSRAVLSGGWKMKFLIVRAMLSKADILLLDEPTNHLDAASVQWLANYLQSQKEVTCLIVSHDPQFLDQVITDVIHYEQKQLVYYPGSLKDFVAIHPQAKYYYELDGSDLEFKLPSPEQLDGVRSNTRTVLKMDDVTYTYPGASAPTLKDCSVKLTLGSRVGVLGVNGAGKSTLIKLLVQEIEPDLREDGSKCGEVWKHHNLRLAYVAQHSFHHIEQHLEVSPVDYIKWRFADGVDKEDLTKTNMRISEEEAAEMQKEKKMGDVLEVLGRRKNGRTMEYECTFVGQTSKDENKYFTLEQMLDMGLSKQVTQCDNRIAAVVAGLDLRPLITREIQSHLDDFNLNAEFGTHGKIKLLSGGQKVKLVLAAAMWNRPHILVLDEPTNYLDREALAALTKAIKVFTGGVVIISHNSEFVNALCTEIWEVKDGTCNVKGGASDDDASDGKASKKGSSVASRRFKSNAMSDGPTTEKRENSGNTNSTKTVMKKQLRNPKTLEYLTKVEIRKLTKCALAAGVPLEEYVSKITKNSPEWKWLSNSIR